MERQARYEDALKWLSAAQDAWYDGGMPPEPDGGLLCMIMALKEVMERHPETRDTVYLILNVEEWEKRTKRMEGHNDARD